MPAKYESAKNLNKTVDFGWLHTTVHIFNVLNLEKCLPSPLLLGKKKSHKAVILRIPRHGSRVQKLGSRVPECGTQNISTDFTSFLNSAGAFHDFLLLLHGTHKAQRLSCSLRRMNTHSFLRTPTTARMPCFTFKTVLRAASFATTCLLMMKDCTLLTT